ncbi:hypothetical protein P6U16_00500 [Rhizobium sp. 32-5/1]|uniref:hypothetical protein n=1 Tax=Rhizobium sp. 32-5/1 TaxID=3019602 RepID=UPI00240E899E|nr:hypothetical protein [Rhizobium sp. 32-5/1]WEZ83410.1 hypothetical protein P6U16_00500 [Rhizobium sp. 32-5/1]
MTRVRQIIRFMHELEAGYDRTLEPIPTDTLFLQPSGPLSGRYLPFSMPDIDDEGLDGLVSRPKVWKPTEEPTPSRWYPARTKGHSRGTMVNCKTRKAITYSSTYERNLAYMMCASKHVVLVEDQPSAVSVQQEDGTSQHTIDYRTTMATGTVIVVGVRPRSLLEKDGLEYTIGTLDRNLPHGFADGATIITDREATDARCWNARSILRALKLSVAADNDRLREYASRFHGTVHIRDLLAGWEIPAYGRNAVWCLIHDEILIPVRPDLKLVDAPYVRFNHVN